MTEYLPGNKHAVRFIRGFRLEDLPAGVLEQAKICLKDLIASSLAGCRTRGASILAEFAEEQLGSAGEAVIIGSGRKTGSVASALINGFIANALDVDDGHRLIKGHPGAVVFPAVLAAAQKTGAGGRAFLEALVVGYEIAIRAGMILHRHYGYYHGSGSWGAMAAAAACARLLDLNGEEIESALGIAEGYGPLTPVMRSVNYPAMAAKDGVAWGAMTGLSAALLAQKGYTGSPSLLGDPDCNQEVFDLGRIWRISHLYFKPYPCCRWSQPAIDGVLALMKEKKLTHGQITGITIRTFAEAAALTGKAPRNIEDAEYSILFPVAAAVVHGEFSCSHLAGECFDDPETARIMSLTKTVVDPEIQSVFPEKCLSRVIIGTRDGRVHDSGLIPARGDWDGLPLGRDELEAKFFKLVGQVWADEQAGALNNLLNDFENREAVELIPYLAGPFPDKRPVAPLVEEALS